MQSSLCTQGHVKRKPLHRAALHTVQTGSVTVQTRRDAFRLVETGFRLLRYGSDWLRLVQTRFRLAQTRLASAQKPPWKASLGPQPHNPKRRPATQNRRGNPTQAAPPQPESLKIALPCKTAKPAQAAPPQPDSLKCRACHAKQPRRPKRHLRSQTV